MQFDLSAFEKDVAGAWRTRVERELKGKSYDDHLVWNSLEGFKIESWQESSSGTTVAPPPLKESWKIVEPIYDNDAQDANKRALDALMNGAEAVWFHKSFKGAAAAVASQGIDTSIAPVFIQGGNCIDPYRALLKGTDEGPHTSDNVELNGLRLRERGANIIEEAAYMLAMALEYCEENGFDQPIFFHTGIGEAFLTEIAKLRALRTLWAGIMKNEGKEAFSPQIIATNLSITYARNDEHSNLLRATSSAMSAVIGGASFVKIQPWDIKWKDPSSFSQRISRNIQTLLKEEGRFDKNLNPADGSYLIENLTALLLEKIWLKVQDILQSGGFSEYARTGILKESIEKQRDQLRSEYAEEKRVLLGVTKYPPSTPVQETQPEASKYALLPDELHLPSTISSASS